MNGIVIAHGKAKEVFDYHSISWKKYLDNIQIVCPEDDAIDLPGAITHKIGKSEHSGFDTCERLRYSFELASKNDGPTAIIEYDVILFDFFPEPKPDEIFACEKRKDGQIFVSDWYAHNPWIVDQKTAKKIAEYTSLYEANYCDRWLAAVCDRLQIAHVELPFSYSPFGGTANSKALKYETIRAVNNGARYVHGNKDLSVSKILDKIYNRDGTEMCVYHTLINDTQQRLFDDYFFPSFPKNETLVVHKTEIHTDGHYMQAGYIDIIKTRCKHIIDSLKAAKHNQVVVWSDIDIIINRRFANDLSTDIYSLVHNSGKSILYQREFCNKDDINGGFFASVADDFSISLYERVYDMICEDPTKHDQDCINQLMLEDELVRSRVGTLPLTYASRSNQGSREGHPKRCTLYHANCTSDMRSKQKMLNRVHAQMYNLL